MSLINCFSLQIVTAAPQKFKIEILPVDDGTPRIVTNLGLQWLEYMDSKVQLSVFYQHNLVQMSLVIDNNWCLLVMKVQHEPDGNLGPLQRDSVQVFYVSIDL